MISNMLILFNVSNEVYCNFTEESILNLRTTKRDLRNMPIFRFKERDELGAQDYIRRIQAAFDEYNMVLSVPYSQSSRSGRTKRRKEHDDDPDKKQKNDGLYLF